ncbi:hypothetical protein EG833_01410, partial [archaeon]|nr:hypothetical protein [archaeon]
MRKNRHGSVLLISLVMAILAVPVSASAANNWSGNGDGLYWSNPDNWDLGYVPLSFEDVFIGFGSIELDTNYSDTEALGSLDIN